MKIYDSVHGFIHFNELESALIDTEVFQRLHYIHQLGISYMIYPGATHTRFEHSLGTMHIATQIFDQIGAEDKVYWRQMVRLAALCHDLGHLPFSHVAEGVLLGSNGHEEWTLKIIESSYLEPIWEKVRREYPGRPITEHIAKLALGKEKLLQLRPHVQFSDWEKIYAEVITGDFFGADRIDYLIRDAKATGLSYGLFDYTHLIEMLKVNEELQLGIDENGLEACEALLLARHFMQRRVYQYPASKAYSFHLARFMKILFTDPVHLSSIEHYLAMSEPQIICELQEARKDPAHPGHVDALALFNRKKRFKAICDAPQSVNYSLKNGPNLPIFRKTKDQGNPMIAIPSEDKNWLYLPPEFSL